MGTSATDSVTITVTQPQLQPLVAVIHANPRSGPAPLTVVFNSYGSRTDPSCFIQRYNWNFGDGEAQMGGTTATHTYIVTRRRAPQALPLGTAAIGPIRPSSSSR
jgi:PKD repeat protein